MTWKKRIISIALCLCALLCAASVRAEAAGAHSHPICGASHTDVGDHTSDNCSTPTWTAWNGGTIPYDANNVAYIYLSDDVILQRNNDTWGYILPLEVGNNQTLYLCLNGHTLSNRGSYTISVSGTLVLCDCEPDDTKGTITHTKNTDGSFTGSEGIYVSSGATFTMYGGTISENERGVLVSGGRFTMYGGEISHNTHTTSSAGGGGVWVKNYKDSFDSSKEEIPGNFAMYGGTICNNEIQSSTFGGGGVGMDSDGSFYMENGTITGNKCNNSGGGLDIRCKTITIKGNSTISNNTCDGDGGGIFAISSGASSITNCTISGNSATGTNSLGGGLTFQNSTFTLKECAITDNKTAGQGGAICLMTSDANLTLSGSMNFSGNKDKCTVDTTTGSLTDDGKANDVFLHTTAYLRLDSTFKRAENTTPIVVTTSYEPNSRGTVKIAEGIASVAKTTDFTYGNDSAIGIIAKTKADGTTVELLACKHNYSTRKDAANHWQECSICGDKKDVAAHSGGKASCTEKAVCQVCNQPYGGLAAHDYDMTTWVKIDDGHHGHKCNNCNAIDATSKASHIWDEGAVTTPAKCTTPGEKTLACAVCSATKKETIPATGHTPGAAVRENEVAATCTTAGSYDEVVYCTACGNELSRTQKTIDKLAHDYDTTTWVKADENQHGHKCKNCDAITDLAAHDPGAAATETTPQLCTKCGYVIAPATHPVHTWVFVAETPATCNATGVKEHYNCTCGRTSFKNGDAYDINADATVLTIEKNPTHHAEGIGQQWQSDSENHWQEYTCCHARANEAAHSGGAATCTAQAVCQVCGRAYGAVLGHTWGAWVVTTPATKDAPGVEKRTCAHNSAHTETRSIPKLSTTVYTVSEDTKIAQIEAKVDGLDKILDSEENKQLAKDGKSVGVSLTVKNTASSGVSEKIKEKLAGSNLVGLRLELTVEKTVTANGVVESKQTIPDTVEPLKTTITLPTELQGKSGYVVYRLHGDAVHVLTEKANENGEFITVSADKTQITICARLYSEYVIAYQTGGSSGGGYHPVNPTPVKATSANTGDAGVLLYGVTAALSLTGTAWLGAKSRKH